MSSEALVDAASDIWAVHDTFADAMATAYRDTAMAQALRDERERSALVAALLEGRVLEDATVWDIADLLQLPRRGPFVVVAAESLQLAQEALPHAETQLRIRGIGSAWRLLPELHVGIIHLPDEGRLGQLADVLAGAARARVGVSPAYSLLTETAAALRFARIAMATSPPGGADVTFFDDHPLAVWRDNGGSATATARQLYCHPNTVRQRLRKLESCTGRSLSDPRETAELFLALHSVLLLPPS